jgi:hypothetical protein
MKLLHLPPILPFLALALLLPRAAAAQTSLGDQRVATSSGTFLKIGVDARAAGLGGAGNAVIQGPGAVFSNPAGILAERGRTSVYFSYVRWPADIPLSAVSVSQSIPSWDAQVAVSLAYLGTDFEETTEFHPYGTGRTVSFSDLVAAISVARNFTDRLAIGMSFKYLREDLGSDIGGPTTGGLLVDAGTVYSIGVRNARLSVTLADFGPDLRPSGGYDSHVQGTEVRYTAFSPPTQFRLGFSMDPFARGPHRVTAAFQVQHQADQEETFRAGAEYWLHERFAGRAGYDLSSDEMGLSAGLGFRADLGGRPGTIDYAFTGGGFLEDVHRWSLSFGF